MKKLRMLLVPLVSTFVLAAVCLHAYGAHATLATTAASCNWRAVASPNPGTGKTIFNTLNGVAAVSANDVWTVGESFLNGGLNQAIIEHWNGAKWQLSKPAPAPSGELDGVVALAANNVWAVGDDRPAQARNTLIEHWNGSSWSIVSSPNPSNSGFLRGVSAVSANDIWAVGGFFNSGIAGQTLIEHWDGSSWKVVPSPNAGTLSDTLAGVKAIASNDVWVVGDAFDGQKQIDQPLVEHWDGKSWKIVSTPAITDAGLSAITAASASDVWAVGISLLNGGTNTNPLIEHWNGTAWSIVTGPAPFSSLLFGVSALSATDVWAVGILNSSSGGSQTLVEHWNGTNWATVTSPNPLSFSFLNAVVAVTTNHVWAVGEDYGSSTTNGGHTLTETQC